MAPNIFAAKGGHTVCRRGMATSTEFLVAEAATQNNETISDTKTLAALSCLCAVIFFGAIGYTVIKIKRTILHRKSIPPGAQTTGGSATAGNQER